MIKNLLYGISLILAMVACSQPPKAEISLEKMNGFPTQDASFLKGVSALYAGAVNGKLWIAGGCNFPHTPVADGGKKVYYDGVYVARLSTDTLLNWIQVGNLPDSIAYGVTISTEKGLICVGGNTSTHSLSSVILLSLQGDSLQTDILPSLPVTMDNMAGALLGHSVYVVGGSVNGVPSSDMYSLDLSALSNGWKKEVSIPGNPRVQPVAVAQDGKLYVWAGFAAPGEGREASLSLDGYVYSPETNEWNPIASPVDAEGNTVSLGGGAGVALDDGQILCIGGVNKDIFLKALQGINAGKEYLSHPAAWYQFNKNIMLYHPLTDEWTCLGQYPQGARAGAALVRDGSNVYIINGELKPGIRTNEINRIKLNK